MKKKGWTLLDKILAIYKKENYLFFSSSSSLVFFGAFLGVVIFNFFWVERFFSRNIMDIRPLFESLPLLLIFLSSAITMKMWTDEKRSGTIELLLTSGASNFSLLFGKFLSCSFILSIAILATLIIPLLLAFLIFNKPKAKIFLNDVGSIPLGYIIGFCLLNIFQNNNWYFFISVFLYFILDVTFTLIMKIKKGHYPWARLFDYLFLQPVLIGKKTHWYVFKHIFLYYFLMSFIIIIIYFYQLDNIYLFIYSLISSLTIFYKFNNFN